ncbi:MAG: hypothetical protein QG657_5370 [Acidobacteriota bacterium]|nr:hypothetical protein [Acidobacteriota bacterium]
MKHKKLSLLLAVVMGILGFVSELSADVVHLSIMVTPTEYSGVCPIRFQFEGKITTDSAGEVTYRWVRSDGAASTVKYLYFSEPGTQMVYSYWVLGPSGEFWKAIEILSPNSMLSDKAVFKLECTYYDPESTTH